jgi:hypothetical protein
VRIGERLPGTTEVLESCFGKLKGLEDGQSKSGFTGLVLSLGANTLSIAPARMTDFNKKKEADLHGFFMVRSGARTCPEAPVEYNRRAGDLAT